MSKPDTWMPFYIGEYLADTMEFTTELHGAYVLLLMHYWRKGPIPDDDTKLAAIAKLPPARWKAARETLGQLPYFSITDGFWRQKRADRELAKAAGLTDKRAAAGVAGASARWGKRDGKPMASAMANASQNDGPLPLPLPSEAIPPNPPQAGGTDASQGEGNEPDRRSPRARGTNPRAKDAAAEEARLAEARRLREADEDSKWHPRLAEYSQTGKWPSAWGTAPSVNPNIIETGVLLPRRLWPQYREIRGQRDIKTVPAALQRVPDDIEAHYEAIKRRTA